MVTAGSTTELEDRIRRTAADLAEVQRLADVGSLEWDAGRNTMRWSEQMFVLLGLTPQEHTPSYERLLACVHPNERESFLTWVDAVQESRRISELHTRIVRSDGTTRIACVRASVDHAPDGTASRVVATFQDVTERMHAEQRFQRLLEAAPDALFVVSRDGTILVANSQAERLFGYAQQDLLGHSIEMLIPGRFAAHDRLRGGFFSQPSARPMGAKRELYGQRKDGTEVPVEISLSPMSTADGTVAICALRDITERRESEAALRHAKAEAEAAGRAKSEFLATMSHEIRTPMNGVVGAIGLLADSTLTSHQRELVAMAESSAKALLAVVNDILDFSKIDADQLVLEHIAFDLLATVEEVGAMFATRADQKGLEIVLRYVPGTRRRFLGDAGRIRQVLTNLVSNAIKFSERGQVMVTVREEPGPCEPSTTRLRITVEDSGIGIEADAIERIFERFSQAETSTTRRFGGTGLGLAICRRLVELMGGTIGVRSDVGAGSTFWFTLPLALAQGVSLDAPSLPESLTGARVLVVDDNVASRRMLQELLLSWHLRGQAVASSDEARAVLKAASAEGDPFHFALVDHSIPGIDDLGTGEPARSTSGHDRLCRIALLSPNARDPERLVRDGRCDGWLVKPVRPSALFDQLVGTRVMQGASAPAERERDRPRFTGHVLVVDDNDTNRRVAELTIRGMGCTVELATSGAEAIARVTGGPYDVVFMDCEMPDMDGFETTREIRRLRTRSTRHARLPIVAMTARALSGDREQCLAAGMDDYVSKPIQISALVSVLRRYLSAAPPDNTPAVTAAVILDLSRLEQLRMMTGGSDPAVLTGVLEAFLRDGVRHVADMQRAVTQGDMAALRRSGHALKGAGLNVGALSVADLSLRIETAREPDAATLVPTLLPQLQMELQRASLAIEQHLTQVLTLGSDRSAGSGVFSPGL